MMRKELTDNQKAWVAALRSGEFQQVRSQLTKVQRGKMSHCCLGVGCELAIKAGVVVRTELIPGMGGDTYDRLYNNEIALVPSPIQTWLGLRTSDGAMSSDKRTLTDCNDRVRMTFAEIADLIEAHAEELFV